MFVMYFVRFKMFKIVDLFLIPMLVLQGLVICLFVFMKGKSLLRLSLGRRCEFPARAKSPK